LLNVFPFTYGRNTKISLPIEVPSDGMFALPIMKRIGLWAFRPPPGPPSPLFCEQFRLPFSPARFPVPLPFGFTWSCDHFDPLGNRSSFSLSLTILRPHRPGPVISFCPHVSTGRKIFFLIWFSSVPASFLTLSLPSPVVLEITRILTILRSMPSPFSNNNLKPILFVHGERTGIRSALPIGTSLRSEPESLRFLSSPLANSVPLPLAINPRC